MTPELVTPARLRRFTLAAGMLFAAALLTLPGPAASAATSHSHTRPDGTAYPDGTARPVAPDRNQGPSGPGTGDPDRPSPGPAGPLLPSLLAPTGLLPLLPPAEGPATARPAHPPDPSPSAPQSRPSAGAGAVPARPSPRSPAPSASSGRLEAASPSPAKPRRGDLAGRLANRPYVPLPPLQAPARQASPARSHGPSRYAPGAVPGAASATAETPYEAVDQGNGVHRVLPLGAGMALTGLGLAFIALRLRRS